MSDKVYVITQGTYSDYHIVGIYDDKHKELAQELVKKINETAADYDKAELNDFDLNEPVTVLNVTTVDMSKEGNVISTYIDSTLSDAYEISTEYILIRINHLSPELCLHVRVPTDNKEKAIKITNEIRTRLIAENKWEESSWKKHTESEKIPMHFVIAKELIDGREEIIASGEYTEMKNWLNKQGFRWHGIYFDSEGRKYRIRKKI